MKRTILVFVVVLCCFACFAQESGNFTDERDGHIYKWVKIGEQVWMAENIDYYIGPDTLTYSDRSKIFYVPQSFYYDYDSIVNAVYSRLYNFKTAKNACPKNWHLPTEEEWTKLVNYLGGSKEALYKLNESGNLHWKIKRKIESTNSSGFNALPGGSYHSSIFYYTETSGSKTYQSPIEKKPDLKELSGMWWSSTFKGKKPSAFQINTWIMKCSIISRDPDLGLSVRCLKD